MATSAAKARYLRHLMIDADDLWEAIEAGDIARLEQLFADHPHLLGPSQSDDALLHVAWSRRSELIPWLLTRGVSPNQRDSLLGTVLMYAAAADATETVALLIAHAADVTLANDSGETAFSYACTNDSFASARLLHAAGADINTIDSGGGSPLDWAACWAAWPFYEWLVSIGCTHVGGQPRAVRSPTPYRRET